MSSNGGPPPPKCDFNSFRFDNYCSKLIIMDDNSNCECQNDQLCVNYRYLSLSLED